MKKIFCILILTLLLPALTARSNAPYKGQIEVSFPDHDNVTFIADIDFATLGLSTYRMVELTPILRSVDGSSEICFDPIVISGSQRKLITARAKLFGDSSRITRPSQIITLRRKTDRIRRISITAPFEQRMRHSEPMLVERCIACDNTILEYAPGITKIIHTRKTPIIQEPYQPIYSVSYIEPEAEPAKVMRDTYSILFHMGKSDIQPESDGHALALTTMNKALEEFATDGLLRVRKISIHGYASPDGYMGNNYNLSRSRAQNLADYIAHWGSNYSHLTNFQGMGEDWKGLRKMVNDSDIDDREKILYAIDSISDMATRKTELKELSDGRTWETLATEYFPKLRRGEYSIEYEVRRFNAQEADSLIWIHPKLLSLNEMLIVAGLYSPESEKYKDAFRIASTIYSSLPIAQVNRGAVEVESGAYDSAIARLIHFDMPESWNNIGIAYWHKGEHEKALEYFHRAADAGLKAAHNNVEQYNLWFEDNEGLANTPKIGLE